MVEKLLELDFRVLGVVTPKVEIPKMEFNWEKLGADKKEEAFKIAGVGDVDFNNLSTREFSKLQFAYNALQDTIVLYDFSKGLTKKDINYFKIIFNKITKKYNKKVILISRDIDFLSSICDTWVIYNNHIIYKTHDIFDDNLYNYIDMPHIVKFIKLANQKGARLEHTTDLNELLKDIYRSIK